MTEFEVVRWYLVSRASIPLEIQAEVRVCSRCQKKEAERYWWTESWLGLVSYRSMVTTPKSEEVFNNNNNNNTKNNNLKNALLNSLRKGKNLILSRPNIVQK